jgi:5'-deoxynucleotidase YfbR-like HD superfamily hydrolase
MCASRHILERHCEDTGMTGATRQENDRWLDTASGRRLNLSNPSPKSIDIEDIAGALSRICRFGGHTSEFYSVAQHSVLVCEVVAILGRPDLRLVALHHDSHEAYLGDMPTPLKRRLRDMDQFFGYSQLAHAIDQAIGQALGIYAPTHQNDDALLKHADRIAFQVEAKRLLPNHGFFAIRDDDCETINELPECGEPLPPEAAADLFLSMHRSLTRERSVMP